MIFFFDQHLFHNVSNPISCNSNSNVSNSDDSR